MFNLVDHFAHGSYLDFSAFWCFALACRMGRFILWQRVGPPKVSETSLDPMWSQQRVSPLLQRRIEGESWDFFKQKSSSSNFCQSLPYLWPCHTRYNSRQYYNRIQANLLSNSPKVFTLQETNISYLPPLEKKKSSSNIPPVWGYVIVSEEGIHNHLHCHGQVSPEVLYNRAWNSRFLISFRCGETPGKRPGFFHQIRVGGWTNPSEKY